MDMNDSKKVDDKKQFKFLIILGVALLLLPTLLSFIPPMSSGVAKENIVVPCLVISIMMPQFFAEKTRRFRMRLFMLSILPILGCWFVGFSLMVLIRRFSIEWPQLLLEFIVVIPVVVLIGLFYIWLTSQPTPKQSATVEGK